MMALCFLYLVKVESSVFWKRSESELGLNLTQIKKNRESYKSPISESFFPDSGNKNKFNLPTYYFILFKT